MSSALAAPPLQDPLFDSLKDRTITRVWGQWLRSLVNRAQATASSIASAAIALTNQNAAIGATSLIPLGTGLYRVTWEFRVTTADGVSSSLRLLIQTTEGGVSCTQNSAIYTGDATNAPQSGVFLVNCDQSSPLQYATTYASNTAAKMKYSLTIQVEQVG